MIDDFKANLFASAHKIARRELDSDDPVWASRINKYFDGAHGFPLTGDPSEYEVAFARTYPEPRDRRTYIDRQISKGSPSFGHRVMAALLATRQMPLLFTTNFDDLIEQASRALDELLSPNDRARLATAALNSTDVAERCFRESDWPLLVKLHGDFQSASLKNIGSELQSQDIVLRRVLLEAGSRFGLAVVGYSGRDASVMQVLDDVLDKSSDPFPAGLYWILRPGMNLLPGVENLLKRAQQRGVETWVVESETFDELFAEIERQANLPPVLAQAVMAARPVSAVTSVEVPTASASRFPALRCNALPVKAWPHMARSFHLSSTMTSDELLALLKERRPAADVVLAGSKVLAIGKDDDMRRLFDISKRDWRPNDLEVDISEETLAFGLMYKALVRALTRGRPLRHRFRSSGHSLYVADMRKVDDRDRRRVLDQQLAPLRAVYGNDLFGTVPNLSRAYAEGVNLRLEHRLGRWWLLFEPYTWVEPSKDAVGPDPVVPWLRSRWVMRRNKEWAAMVDAWARLLAPAEDTVVSAWGLDGGVDASFTLGRVTAWSEPMEAGTR
jgi:hypothetical protein